MSTDEFAGAGQEEGLEIWRIENLLPVLVPKPMHGKFYTGDSYLILKTYTQPTKKWNLHFWLGNETSSDEMGVAAYKTVDLDDYLGGGPVQYRECQGAESSLFMGYFKETGIEFLPGGVASGFTHVERDTYENRLLHLKGKRTVVANEVECKASSLVTGDAFILDLGLQLYLWNGSGANMNEKAKAAQMIQKIKDDERGGRASVTLMDEDPDNADFWGALGGQVEITNEGESDSAFEAGAKAAHKLFLISDDSGEVEFTEMDKDENGNLLREMLAEDDVCLLDAHAEIFVWIGSKATAQERKEGMIRAQSYLVEHNRPLRTNITRIVQNGETSVFKSLFYQWEPPRTVDFGRRASTGVAGGEGRELEGKKVDVAALTAAQPQQREQMVDDGSGSVQVWRIEDMDKVPVDESLYGQFFAGDSYIVLYTYMKGSSEEYMLYFWQGNASSKDEIGASALLATQMDDEMGGKPVQCRVTQGKEPAHFRQIFKGKMVVHSGGKASGFKNTDDSDSYDTDGVSLYHVKGSSSSNTYAVQVEEKCASLNSGDCFVLLTPSKMFSWMGMFANDKEKEVATNIAEMLKDVPPGSREVVVVEEQEEPEEFFTFLGGKTEYADKAVGDSAPQEPRLFQCTNATGVFSVSEIFDFAQSDLCDDDVMLLDTFTTVFLWVGTHANEQEVRMSEGIARDYIDLAADGREKGSSIIKVKAANEPLMFACNFVGWDVEYFSRMQFTDPYAAKLAKLKEQSDAQKADEEAAAAATSAAAMEKIAALEAKPAPEAPPEPAEPAAPPPPPAAEFDEGGEHSYDSLKDGIPAGVNPAAKEIYLSAADFQEVFKMSKDDFKGLAKWKQTSKKKEVGLF